MAVSRTTSKAATEAKPKRLARLNFFGILYKLNLVLMTIGLLIWIFVGSFFSISVIEQLKSAAQQKVMSQTAAPTSQVESPKNVNIPGIGMVSVECVKNNVKQEVIQKISGGSGDTLTPQEKSMFDSCLVQNSASPSANPKQ